MFGNVQQGSGPSLGDDDSDSISLNSVDDQTYDSGTEFVVEDVHCEKTDPRDAILKYLVEWANFPLDECTWEPEDGLPQELRDQWETKKATQDPSVAADFEKKYNEAFNEKLEERRQLHRRRNAKRKRHGLPATNFYFRGYFYPDSEDDVNVDAADEGNNEAYSESAAPSDSEPDEAEEDNAVDLGATDSVLSLRPSPKKDPQKTVARPNPIFKTSPDIAPEPKAKTGAKRDKDRSRQQPQKSISTDTPAVLPKANSTSSLPDRQQELPSTTGYQGSARRPSTTHTKPTPRRPGVSAIRPGNTPLGTTATASNLAKKSITAKKTGQAPISSVNIFTGGKKQQTRRNLGNTMTDASKGPKFFTKARIRRKAELRSRDNDDLAPDPSQVTLFNISRIPPPRQNSRQQDEGDSMFVSNTDDHRAQTDAIVPVGLRRSSTTTSEPKSALSKRSSFGLDGDRARKKAKSVRFTGEDDQPFVSEPMEICELPGPSTRMRSPPPPPKSPSPPPPTAPKARLSLADYHSRTVQSVSKKIVLAPGNQSLDVIFNGIPKDGSRESGQQWLPDFLDTDCLRFGHTVLADSLIAQLGSLRRQDQLSRGYDVLCSGTITTESGDKLNILAEHLRVGHVGLLVAHENYNLVIYPTKCAGFQMELLGVESADTDGVALRYFAFGVSHNISRLIRPISDETEVSTDIAVGQEQKAIFRKLLDLRYYRLVAGPCEDKEHHFFLIFPDAAVDWYRSMCCWLSGCKQDCKIYTSFDPGSWYAFLGKANGQCGVVIIHEAAVSSVRRIPCVTESLQNHNIQYWCFSESVDIQNARPYVPHVKGAAPTSLSRIFPWGKAILLTPSFVVSQPQKTYELLRWYFPNQAKHSMKLVTAYNIVDYLRDLTNEKCVDNAELNRTRWRMMSSSDVALEKKSAGLTDEDLIARGSAWAHAEDWLSVSMERNGVFSEDNHVIFADRSIDPNDEQSLVNWFGWWSLTRAEEYRKFFVLGSSSSIQDASRKGRNSPNTLSRACRTIPIPKYERYVVSDPDEALRNAMRDAGEPVADEVAAAPAAMTNVRFPSDRYFANNEDRIAPFLSFQDRAGRARVFNRPICWADFVMADHFGDPTARFATIQQWFRWPFPWLGDLTRTFNTYLAFFYTIKEDWDPAKFPRGIKPKRHPWLAIYRPVEPHNKSGRYRHGRTELIIWDVRAGDELEGNFSLALQDLIWMQRELVRFVQAHGAEKNPGSTLERVWLGGFQVHQADCSSTLAADMTAEWLEITLEELKWKLPSTDKNMRQNGWRQVSLLDPSVPQPRLNNRQSFSFDGAADEASDDDEARIIFHPPRGSGSLGPRGSSKCTNDLYMAARLARSHDSSAREMEYTFRPTMEWYDELKAEGRQYEHIFVDEWEKVFAQLGVNQSQRSKQDKTSTNLEQYGQSRKNSVTSNHSSSMDVSPY